MSKINRVEYIQKGLYSGEDILRFESDGSESHISESGNATVHVTSLDRFLEGREVTYIKMDIEGSELEALKGAAETIKNNKPRLAISIYHKPEDILEIPSFILDLNSEYRFYIRHYSMTWFDTVLYAI